MNKINEKGNCKNDVVLTITEVKESTLRDKAELYKDLKVVADFLEEKMMILKKSLLESKVEEYFIEDEYKVLFTEEKHKSEIDTKKVFGLLNTEDFISVAKVSETALKEIGKEEIIKDVKIILEEKTSPTISVRKLSKDDKKILLG